MAPRYPAKASSSAPSGSRVVNRGRESEVQGMALVGARTLGLEVGGGRPGEESEGTANMGVWERERGIKAQGRPATD